MAIEFVGRSSVSQQGETSGTMTMSLTALTGGIDTAARTDDLVVIVWGIGSSGDRAMAITTTGYTVISELYANDTSDTNLEVAYKRMGPTADTSVVFPNSGSSNNGNAALAYVFRGVDPTTPLDVTSTTATGINSGRPNPPPITPTTAGTVILVAGAAANSAMAVFTQSTGELSNFFSLLRTEQFDIAVGAGTFNWVATPFDPIVWAGGTTNTAASWAAVTLALRPANDNGNSLTSTNIVAGSPVVSSSTIAQKNVLTATAITAGSPVVGSSTIAQTNFLSTTSLIAGAPVVGTTTLVISVILTSTALTAGVPVIGSPALESISSQNDLTSTSLTSGAPVVGPSTIVQRNTLTSVNITSGNPVVNPSTIRQLQVLLSTALTANVPVVNPSTISQGNALQSVSLLAENPVVNASILGQVNALTANNLLLGTPIVNTSTIAQRGTLTSVSLTSGNPVIQVPTFGTKNLLVSTNIVAGAGLVGTSSVTQNHSFAASNLTSATPVISGSSLGVVCNLAASGLVAGSPSVSPSSVAQRHILGSLDVVSESATVETSSFGQNHSLSPVSIQTPSGAVGIPVASFSVNLTGNSVTLSSPVLSEPVLAILSVSLAGIDIVLESPIFGTVTSSTKINRFRLDEKACSKLYLSSSEVLRAYYNNQLVYES